MKFDIVGDYISFGHKPTEKEISEAAHELTMKLSCLIEENAVILSHYPAFEARPEQWTVGVKFYLPRKAPRVKLTSYGESVLTDLRLQLRRYHYHGGEINISRLEAPIYERALAAAARELGLLDKETAVKVYGFCEASDKNTAVDSC